LTAPKNYTALVFFALVLIVHCGYGQTNIRLGGKDFTIPKFRTDTLTAAQQFVKEDDVLKSYHFIKPISSSADDFEVRCFFKVVTDETLFSMVIIKGSRHRMSVSLIRCPFAAVGGDRAIGVQLAQYVFMCVDKSRHHLNLKRDSVLNKLIGYGLFDYPDKTFFDSPRKYAGTEENRFRNLLTDYVFEIKLNNQYHSFRFDQGMHVPDSQKELFNNGLKIIEIFRQLAGVHSYDSVIF
jgi:hypothetical protein